MRLVYDRRQNALRVSLTDNRSEVAVRNLCQGVVDVGEGGRLLGVEFKLANELKSLEHQLLPWLLDGQFGQYITIDPGGNVYIELTEQYTGDVARSCDVEVTLELDSKDQLQSITFPRSGSGYEITYPSGNR